MLIIYRILINFIFLLSPIIIFLRLIKKKEDPKRFLEKFNFFSEKRKKGNLIWFHGASVGELQSIIPLVEKFEKDKNINQILITSNTLSSSKIIQKQNLKKTIHQFFPIDTDFISRKFIDYWKPSKAFFIDSEIWPNMIFNLKKKNIPIVLVNGRITRKTFRRWKVLNNFSNTIFSNFDLCLSSTKESFQFLKKLNVKKVKFLGNLKFAQSENENLFLDKRINNYLKSKRAWCASSTHDTEELISGMAHLELKKNIKNLITIIIPRHIERSNDIKNNLESLNLKVHLDEPFTKIAINTDIYLVNSYGKTKSFYRRIKNVFLGGSLIKHGGQNPLEAVRYGCKILHGPNVDNFKEIYHFLKKIRVSNKIINQKDLVYNLKKLLSKKDNNKKIQKKLKTIGQKILNNTYKEIKL